MALIVLRLFFLMVAAGLGVQIAYSDLLPNYPPYLPTVAFGLVMAIAVAVMAADWVVRRKRLDVITSVYFGTIIGLFLTYVVKLALTPVLPTEGTLLATYLPMTLGMSLCYACISVLLQTKDDFRFIIPYVEFQRKSKGLKPLVLDTSVLIDGRIADVVETRVLDSPLVVPRFVIAELQAIADSDDKLRRNRGRRGLDVLNRLKSGKLVDLQVFDAELPEFEGHAVDQKLVTLARHLDGRLVTNDFNLNKVAKAQDVPVLNLNELANALKPIFLPGEGVVVRVIKPGEEPRQGVGYLEDGTMVVVENGRDHLGEEVSAQVTSVLQTNAGRMVFARFERGATPATPAKKEPTPRVETA